jgi:hypothetical protein
MKFKATLELDRNPSVVWCDGLTEWAVFQVNDQFIVTKNHLECLGGHKQLMEIPEKLYPFFERLVELSQK